MQEMYVLYLSNLSKSDTSATQEASDGYLVNELGLEKKNGHIYLFLPDNNHQ